MTYASLSPEQREALIARQLAGWRKPSTRKLRAIDLPRARVRSRRRRLKLKLAA